MSSAGSSKISKLCSTWGPGYVGRVTDFVELVQTKYKYHYHIVKAWTAWDKADGGLFSHEWVILEVQPVETNLLEYLSDHRFDDEDVVCIYDGFEEALRDCSLRKSTNPWSNIFLEVDMKSLLIMLDYILENLRQLNGKGYNLRKNNCRHFAENLKACIEYARKLTDVCITPPPQIVKHADIIAMRNKWNPDMVYILSRVGRDEYDNRDRSIQCQN